MDYPKSVENVGLVDGKFVNEDPVTGTVGSLIPAEWGNSVTDELLGVISAAGLAADEASVSQLLQAIRLIIRAGAASYAADTGAANAYVAAYTPAVTALSDGLELRFKAVNANTGASTFSPNGLAAKAIVSLSGQALGSGEIAANSICTLVYSSTLSKWVLKSATGGSMPKGLSARQTLSGTPTANAAFTWSKAFSTFVAPCDGYVLMFATVNYSSGTFASAAITNNLSVTGSTSGSSSGGDTTLGPMTNSAMLKVTKGETVSFTAVASGSATNVTWPAISHTAAYLFVPTN